MSFFSYLRVELNRLFRSRMTWLVVALSAAAPLAGYGLYKPVYVMTRAVGLVANPLMTGALAGAVLFALLTFFELDRVHRSGTAALTDTIASPLALNSARLVALLAAATAASVLVAAAYLPYTAVRMGANFDAPTYFLFVFVIMLPSLWLAVLASAAFYQVVRRVDLGFVMFISFVLLSMGNWFYDNYLMRWVNPLVPTLSDDFSNAVVFRTAAYNRMFWFSVLTGVWLLSLICVRRYGKGLFGSLAVNLRRRPYMPVLAAGLIVWGCHAYIAQPFIDHSPLEFVQVKKQMDKKFALKDTRLDVVFNTRRGTLSGTAVFRIINENSAPRECRLEINPGYTIDRIVAGGRPLPFKDLRDDTNYVKHIVFDMPAGPENELSVSYHGAPRIWAAMRKVLGHGEIISRRFINVRNAHFEPMLEMPDAKEGIETTGRFTMPGDMVPVVTGDTVKLLSENADGTKTWLGHDTSRGLTLYAGDYVKTELAGAGMPVEFYYSRRHQAVMEKLSAKQVMEYTIAYCTARYGRLPFTPGRPLKIIQNSAFMFGGGAFSNFSVMGETYFSDTNLNDRRNGASSAEVLAHETVHQWWGLSGQCRDDENMDWTNEGVTVYTTYRIAKERFGEEYARKNYVEKWKEAVDDKKKNFYNRHPEYLKILPEKYAAELRSGNIGTGEYSLMPLQIYKAAGLAGGEERMDAILAGLYKNGGETMPPFITYGDFLKACGVSAKELDLE